MNTTSAGRRSLALSAVLLTVLLWSVPSTAATPGGSVGYSYTLGFDMCEAPSTAVMQSMWNSKPYFDMNLYIGGAERGCANSQLSAAWVSDVNAIGYSFIPTWVGPQAPCGSYVTKISLNTTTADAQGRSEATAAVNALAALGFTTGTVVYYDIEGYDTTNVACRDGVKAFINGWDVQLRETYAMHPGVYGSDCGSAMGDFATLGNVPDDVWVANWSGVASVWNLSCVGNASWSIQPPYGRIHQYSAPHNETTIDGYVVNIDNDCEWGLVTPNGHGPNPGTPQCPGTHP